MTADDPTFTARNANDSWSLTELDDGDVLRFEVRDGDYAAMDAQNYTKNERSDAVFDGGVGLDTPVEVNFGLNLEPGAANSASFLVLGQFIATMSDGSTAPTPPFDLDLIGDQLAAYVRYTNASGTVTGKTIYIADAALTRGQTYNIDVKANFDPSGNGQLVLSIDGTVVANYSGPLGYAGQQSANWAEGINRGANATETTAVDYIGTSITSGTQVAFPDPAPYVGPPSLSVGEFSPVAGQAGVVAVPVAGYALGNTPVTIFSNGVAVATVTAASNGYYATTLDLSGEGNHYLQSSYVTPAGQTSVSTAPTNVYVEDPGTLVAGTPNILILNMDGAVSSDTFWVQNAGQPWSLTSPEAGTLRFEVRDNDVFVNDKNHGTFSERSEVKDQTGIPDGTPVDVSYQFQIEPGPANDAAWCIIGQLHPGDVLNSPIVVGPPFEIALSGDKMQINIVATDANGLPYVKTLYTDVANIDRGHYYDIEVKAVFDPAGNGRLVVIRDGVTLVDYSGSLGYAAQTDVYWREGIYRSSTGTVTMAADYRGLSITSGDSVTFPDKSAFIPAPGVTSSSVAAAPDGSTNRVVTLNGTVGAGSTVTLTENGTTLGTGTADGSGAYSIAITINPSVAHYISAFTTDTSGRNGISSSIVVDTAADVVANIASIQAGSSLTAVVLTDTNVLSLPASLSVATFSKAYAATLAKIVGSYSYLKVTTVTGQAYDTIRQSYASSGALVETDRLAGTRLISSQAFAADGSQVFTSYSSTGSNVSTIDKTGRTIEADAYTTAGILTSKTTYAADGSRLTLSFNATTGVETGYTAVDATGAKQVATVNIAGQAYATQILTYNAAGKQVKQERITAAGVEILTVQNLPDGSSVTQQFNASGAPTSTVIRLADGSFSTETFQIANKPYAAQTIFTSAANKVVGTDTFDASGKLLTSQRTNADGSATVFAVGADGNATGYTQTFANGTKAVALYAAGSARQLASVNTFSASGALVEADAYGAAGQKASTDVFAAGGGDLLTTFDPATGLAATTAQTNADGSKVVTAYQPGSSTSASVSSYAASGTLVETDAYNAAGQKVSTDVFAAGGGDLLTTFDPTTGLVAATAQTNADGSRVVTTYQPGSSTPASISRYAASGMATEIDAYDTQGREVTTNVFLAGGGNLLTSFDPASGLVVSTAQVGVDGSQTLTTFQPGSTLPASVATYTAAGAPIEIDVFGGSGQQVSTDVFAASGGDLLTTFDPASGLATGTTQTNADGSKTVTVFQPGSTGPANVDIYGANGIRTESDIYRADGSSLQTSFDPVTGLIAVTTTINADGSKSVATYQVGSSTVLAGNKVYAASGVLVESDGYGASGTQVSSDVFTAGAGDLLTTFDANGVVSGTLQTNADGSRKATAYQPGSASVLASVANYSAAGVLSEAETYDATGRQVEVDGYDALGRKTSSIQRFSDGSRASVTLDGASGAVLQSSTVHADGSRTDVNNAITGKSYAEQSTSYSAAGKVVGLMRYYGDAAHTLALSQVTNADGSVAVHNYDAAGRETSRTLTAADGSAEVVNSSYTGSGTQPTTVQDYHYAPGNKLLWSDTTNANGSHNQVAAGAGVSLTSTGGVADSFTAASAGADTFVFQPAFGQDMVTNFHAGAGAAHDTLDLGALHLAQGPGQSSLDVLAQSIKQVGRDAVLTLTPTDTVTLKNTTVASLTKENFRV